MPEQVKDTKVRRPFTLRANMNVILAKGVVYEQGNVQVLWRQDIGWCGEQYQSTANLLDLFPNVTSFHWEEE